MDKLPNEKIELLYVGEVAEMLNVKSGTVYKWASQGKLPSYKIGGNLQFIQSEIVQFILSCKQ